MRKYLTAALLSVSVAGFIFITTARAADDTAALYKSKCVACHGEDGASQTSVGKSMKAPDLRSEDVQKKTDEQLSDVILKGQKKMAPTKGVTADQAKQLVAHMRALAKKK